MSVNSIAEVCRLLYSEKITERKKATDRFKGLLKDSTVVTAIDRCNDEKSTFNWNCVLQSVINHIQKELEVHAKLKTKTAGTPSNRTRIVTSSSSLLKLVVRKANLIKARLSCQLIIEHVISVLQDEDACAALGTEYSSILLNEVLEKRHVWSTIPHDMWQALLNLFGDLYSQSVQNLDRSLLMKTLERIISIGSKQTQLSFDALFTFFTDVAKKLRREVTSHQETCVSALTAFSRAVALQCRIKLCSHGEDVLHYVMHLWEGRASSQKKDILIEYMQIQMEVHHPGGALTPDNGAFICDPRSWKITLQKMYNCLQQELKEMLNRSRYAQSKQNPSFNLSASFLRLLVEVCRQVNEYALDNLNTSVTEGSIQKKRKKQTAFCTLLDTIHEHAESPNVVYWLQLLTAWLSNFPDTLKVLELQDLVLQLHQMIINCKKSEIVDALLNTCLACIGCHVFIIKQRKSAYLSPLPKISHWALIFNEVQSTLNLSVTRESRLKLITALVKFELVNPGLELWQLFGDNSRKCSDNFLELLAMCKEKSPLPEHCLPNASVEPRSSSTAKARRYEFRFQLLDWLLPCLMDEERQLYITDAISVKLLADILCSLVFRNASHEIVSRKFSSSATNDYARKRSNIEDFYLRSYFFLPSMDLKTLVTNETSVLNKTHMQDNTVLPEVIQKLVELLIRDVCHLLEVSGTDTGYMNLLANRCCLLIKVMQQLIARNAIGLEEIAKHRLTHHIHALLKKLVDCLEKCRKSAEYASIFLQVLDVLSPLVVNNNALEAAFMRSVTPQKLVELFMEVLNHLVTLSNSRLSTPMESDEDLFDSSSEFSIQDDFEDASQNPAYFAQRIRTSEDLLNPAKLNDVEQLTVKIGEFLSLWSSLDSHPLPRQLKCDTDSVVLKMTLLELIKDTGFDFQTPLNLQLALKVVTNLLSKEQYHNEDTFFISVVIVKTLFTAFHKDVGITAVGLDLLKNLIYHAGKSSPKNQEATVHQLKAFWKLHTKKKLGVKLLIGFIQCVAEISNVDKANTWGRWEISCSGENIDDSSSDSPVVLSLVQLLKHSSYDVMMAAAANLPVLVGYSEDEQLLPEGIAHWKNKVIQSVFKACREAEPETVHPNTDSAANYTAFLLRVVAGIAKTCPYCDNAAIIFLFEISSKKNVDLITVNKVLDQILCDNGYSSCEEFAADHLKSILNFWLERKWALQSFPYQLLNCSSAVEFFQKYTSVIVVMVLLHTGVNGLDELSGTLKEDPTSLITKCVPHIVAELLPAVVSSKQNSRISCFKPSSIMLNKAESSFAVVEEFLTKEVLQNLMSANLTSIMVHLMLLIQDDEGGENGTRRIMPPTMPYVYPASVIISTCEEVVQRTNCKNHDSVISALAEIQDGLQTVLLELKLLVFRPRGFYKKWRSLLIFTSFARLLFRKMDTNLAGNRVFIIHDVIYTLVHLLNANSHAASVRCAEQVCLLLQEVCLSLVENCHDEIGKHLRVIVGTLVSLQLPRLKTKAMELLKILLLSNEDTLSDYIRCLDPLPDTPEMSDVLDLYQKVKYGSGTFSLKKEIHYFLKAADSNAITFPRVDGLRYLKKQLASRKEELKNMFDVLQDSEDCSGALLHQLVVELLHLSISPCEEEALEAGRCLGEIGPADLSNLVLKVGHSTKHKQIFDAFDDDPQAQRNTAMFKVLLEYLFSNDFGLVSTISHALKEILGTHTGQQFLLLYESKDLDNMVHILHPFTTKQKLRKSSGEVSPQDIAVLCDSNLWTPDAKDHQSWIIDLVVVLLAQTTDEVLVQLADVARMKYDFCEKVLPYVIHSLLSSDNQDMQDILSQSVSSFFEKHCAVQDVSVSSRSSSQTSGTYADAPVYNNHQSIKTMLSVIQYLRTQNRSMQRGQITTWENNFWLSVNYFHVARAAIYCRAYFTSLIALEIWFDDVTRMSRSHRQSLESVLYNSDDIYTSTYRAMPALQEKIECEAVYSLILESYRSIGEPDGGYGCGAAPLTKPSIRVMQYEQENQWQKALSTYDSEAHHTPSSFKQGLPKTLKILGLSHLLQRYLHHSTDAIKQDNLQEFQELEYECAWRLGQWSSIKQTGSKLHFHESIYNSLTSIQEGDFPSCANFLQEGQRCLTQELSSESFESTYSIYPYLSRMQMLSAVEDYSSVASVNSSVEELITKWKKQDNVTQANFLFTEPIISLQSALLQQIPTSLLQMRSLVERLDLKIQFARNAGYLQIAAATVNSVKLLKHLDEPQSWRCQLQEARTFWQQEESQIAMHLIRNLLSKLELVFRDSPAAATIYSNALGVYSNWLIEARSESPNVILNYLDTAIKVCSDLNNSADLMDACLAAGRFADSHYQRIQHYKKSEMFEAKQELIQKSRREAEMLKLQGLIKTQDQLKAIVWLEKQSKIDEKELIAMEEDQHRFLEQALVNYLGCLKAGDACNLRVFRLTSLWFQNQHVEKVNVVLQKALSIKTHKFLPVMYQSAARMSTEQNPFQNTLEKLIEQVASDHPHHTLPIILALCNAKADKLVNQTLESPRQRKASEFPQVEEEERIAAAKNVWGHLRAKPHLTELMEKMEKLCTAYISLSNTENPKKTAANASIPISSKAPLMKLPNLSIVPDVTMNIPVEASASYSSVPGIARIEPYYKLCGGVTAPKKLVCVGTDGVKRTQLLKGRDDLRQDAVMQQVFGIVNSMLKQNSETKKRNLHIRTYKVVPLSQRSGILQWCTGTLPIGDYLVGDQGKSGSIAGAHGRYYPKDWTGSTCRKKLMDVASNTPERKLQGFYEICRNLHPVFRHFFMENFTEPAVWFESRLMYTKSVATTSMVGYILGLGDRHVQNILIDQKTAELIHIDLGVAFEQGKVLPTPETVPFRLTRDIIDGMGVIGVEGVYRRCCEKTLHVLRQSQEVVTTILDVLLYDPLYVWSISPMKACTLQPEPIETQIPGTARSVSARDMRSMSIETQKCTKDGEPNKHAERCLLRVQLKLQGMEEGVTMSVMGQVNRLIHEATDPKNLCRLYSGWQPYL